MTLSLKFCCFFFFSSRRRHTRSDRDWSSDVCSSDLFAKWLVAGQISLSLVTLVAAGLLLGSWRRLASIDPGFRSDRSEEHTSELQSRSDLVCRLLLEKKKKHYIHDRCT